MTETPGMQDYVCHKHTTGTQATLHQLQRKGLLKVPRTVCERPGAGGQVGSVFPNPGMQGSSTSQIQMQLCEPVVTAANPSPKPSLEGVCNAHSGDTPCVSPNLPRLVQSLMDGSLCLNLSSTRTQHTKASSFYVGAGNTDLALHTPAVCILPTELPPEPQPLFTGRAEATPSLTLFSVAAHCW